MIGVPKPAPRPKRTKLEPDYAEKVAKVRAAQDKIRARSIAKQQRLRAEGKWPERKPLPRGTKKIPQVNAKRLARRMKDYAKYLGSKEWKAKRRLVWERDRGLCQCPECVQGRKDGVAEAFEQIPIWFDKRGGIHGFAVHHTSYARFKDEPLEHLLLVDPKHHERWEAKSGIRKRFLRGSKG